MTHRATSTFRSWALAGGLAALASTLPSPGARADAWDADNDPARFGLAGSLRFSDLPATGTVARRPWVGHSWKERKGGIAYRWQSGTRAWDYSPLAPAAIARASEKEVALLSPAEKFDLLTGREDFPTVWVERERNAQDALSWYGLCHGWALSATLFAEPEPVVMTSPAGRRIPFGSADVKALLAYYAGEALFARRQFVGLRCNDEAPSSPACRDMNAGAFHVLLANEVGREKRSFVVELSADEEIWNKPVLSYASQVESRRAGASPGAAPGTSEEVTVRTSVTYVHNTDPSWDAQPGSDSLRTYSYRYRLELNPGGIVVGGAWLQSGHPDFAWTLLEPKPLGSLPAGVPLARLADLYEASTGDACATRGVGCADATSGPGRDPVANDPADGLACPNGYALAHTPAGLAHCRKDELVFGPVTPVMRDACKLSGRGAACDAPVWNADVWLAAAGPDRCPRGSAFDDVVGRCSDESLVYGPFSKSTQKRCREMSTAPGQVCEAMQWQSALFNRVWNSLSR